MSYDHTPEEVSGQPPEDEKRVIRVGASGFSYDDWIGPVYPQGTKRADMLSYYANELKFDLVELNYTYYTMPAQKGVEGMLSRVEPDFTFIAKAHQSLTHKIRDESGGYIRDETAVATFKEGLAPMIDGGRLACVLAQFPMKFGRGTPGKEHIAWLAERLAPTRLVVEFRNKAWIAQSVFDFLKNIGVGYCVVDEPDLPSLSPFMPVATTDIAYFRFHGRNKKWFGVSAAQRHNYEYSDPELRQFITPINKVARQTRTTLILFNNHFGGQAVRNAMAMRELLGLAGQKAVG